MPGYKPGATVQAVGGRSFKLSSNECPFGPLPSVANVIAEAALGINRYPDNGAELLTGAIAERYGVDINEVRLVAAHSWDVSGALAAGARAAFVARPGMVPSPLGDRPDIVGAELAEVIDQIIATDIPREVPGS